MIELYNNYAYVTDNHILNYLMHTCSGIRYTKWQVINHMQKYHNDYDAVCLIKKSNSNIPIISKLHPRCKFCSTITESLVIDEIVPIGLLDIVPTKYYNNINIVDKRIKPISNSIKTNGLKLYDYQKVAADALIQKERGFIQIPTGGGKTEVAIYIATQLGLKTIIIVPTTIIFEQFIKRFKKYGIDVGQFGDGKHNENLINVCIVNSIIKNEYNVRKVLHSADVLILDEHHRYGANSWYPIILDCPAYYRFGQSATPFRDNNLDTLKLIALTGNNVSKISIKELQQEGKLSHAIVNMIIVGGESGIQYESFVDIRRTNIVEHDKRNNIIIDIAKRKIPKKVLILVAWKEHAEILSNKLGNIKHVVLTGGIKGNKIQKIKDAFANDDCNIMIATTTADEGMDIPGIEVLIICGGGKAIGRAQQRLGRALRTSTNKDIAEIYDLYDNHLSILKWHSECRKKAYEALGFTVNIIS